MTAPGDLMQIDSTPLDVLVRLDDGVVCRVDLTGIIDVATRTVVRVVRHPAAQVVRGQTVTAAVLRPTTRSVDASVLLARTVTPEPMRPGWPARAGQGPGDGTGPGPTLSRRDRRVAARTRAGHRRERVGCRSPKRCGWAWPE